MSWMQRLWNSFKRESLNSGIDEELAFHIEERAEELVEQGMSLEEARRQASVQLGGYNSFKEEMGEINTFSFIADIGRDLGVGIRMLAQSPAFAATAILSLALGIGANTALFSIVNALMLRSLPVADARQIVSIDSPQIGSILTYPIWEQMRDRQQGFAGLLAYSADKFDLAASGESRFAQGLWVSGDFFRVLGVPAEEGRIFTREEDRRGTLPVAVISDSFRRRNFPAEASVIGKTLRLNRHQFEIVGVTPAWFRGLTVETSFDVAVPLACEPILHSDHSLLDERSGWWLSILGRLKPGTTVAQAETDLKAAAPAILEGAVPLRLSVEEQKQFLQSTFVLHPAATGFSEVRVQYKSALFALMGAACLVLLITCANVANLLLARASARQRELAVRLAVGAARMRIVRQLVTESFLLSVAGTGLGFVLALLGSHALVGLITTAGNPLYIDLSPDWRMLFFTAAIAVLTVLLFGFAPAFRATRYDLNQVLKKDGRGAVPGSTRFHLGKALVAAQIALSLTVLVAASLFVTTLKNLLSTDLGFNGRAYCSPMCIFRRTPYRKNDAVCSRPKCWHGCVQFRASCPRRIRFALPFPALDGTVVLNRRAIAPNRGATHWFG